MQKAPQAALDILKERPELSSQFRDKYGYIPAPQPALNALNQNPDLKSDFEDKYGYLPDEFDVGRLKTAGSEFVKGVGDIPAGTLKALGIHQSQAAMNTLSIMDAIDRGEIKQDYLSEVKEKYGFTVNDYNSQDVNQYFQNKEAPIPALISRLSGTGDIPIRERLRQKNLEASGEGFDPTKTDLFKSGEAVDKFLSKNFKSNPEFRDEFISGKVPRGLGSMVGFVGSTIAGRGMGGAVGGVLATAGTGAAVNSQSQFLDAINNDATLEEAFEAADIGALVGTSEIIPIASILNRVDKGTGGLLKRTLVNMVKGGTEEAIQEGFQQVMNNLTASDLVAYDPDRGMWTGTGEGAAVGFTTGALVSAIGTLIGGRRSIKQTEFDTETATAAELTELENAEIISAVTSSETLDDAINTATTLVDEITNEVSEAPETLEADFNQAVKALKSEVPRVEPTLQDAMQRAESDAQFFAEQSELEARAAQDVEEFTTGKATEKRLDPERRDRGERRRLQMPDEFLQQIHREKVAKHGLNEEQAEAFAPRIETDGTTGYYNKRELEPAIERALQHSQDTGEATFYAEVDLANMGGANKAKGSNVRFDNEFYAPMATMLREEVESVGGDVIPVRAGGDELGFVVANATEQDLQTALSRAADKTAQMAVDQGMGDIINPKYPNSSERGITLYFGVTPILEGKSAQEVRQDADTQVNLNKIERNQNGNGQTTGTPRPATPSRQAGAVESGTGAPVSGVSESSGTFDQTRPEQDATPGNPGLVDESSQPILPAEQSAERPEIHQSKQKTKSASEKTARQALFERPTDNNSELNSAATELIQDLDPNQDQTPSNEGVSFSGESELYNSNTELQSINRAATETTNVSGQPSNLERNRSNSSSTEPMGQGNVQVEQPGNDSKVRETGRRVTQTGDEQQDNSGISAPATAHAGIQSDSTLHQQNTETGVSPDSARNIDSSRRDDSSGKRVSDDRRSSAATGTASEKTAELNARLSKQQQAEPLKVVVGNLDNIRETLPALFEEQQDDVAKAETRFYEQGKPGILFTNGTGTGKTYTGLGIAKRFDKQGKHNILIVVPTDVKAKDWIEDGKNVLLDVKQLKDINDRGQRAVITTYANFYQNNALVHEDWDLIIYDESHYLGQNEAGSATEAQGKHKALTNHPEYIRFRARLMLTDEFQALKQKTDQYREKLEKTGLSKHQAKEESDKKYAVVNDRLNKKFEKLEKQLTKKAKSNPTKAVFLSASPFAYVKNIDYAEGYIFDYDRDKDNTDALSYNKGGGREQFFMSNFGYRMRYNKLTRPEAGVNNSLMERNFYDSLKNEGAVSGRQLKLDKDYSRDFVLAQNDLGEQIDEGMRALSGFEEYESGGDNKFRFQLLAEYSRKKHDYHYKNRLLESIKAREAISRIHQHLKLGRKVIVFHGYKTGAPSNPFKFPQTSPLEVLHNSEGMTWSQEVEHFYRLYPHLRTLNLSGLNSVPATLKNEFRDRLVLFNGDVSKKVRAENVKAFNQDGSGVDVIVVQMQAGKEGISLHDTSGKHQRVMLQMGLPISPTDAIQSEGRNYRVGVQSNAIQEYMKLGLWFEDFAFATKISQRSATAENLAMGSAARDLERAFIDGYENASIDPPSHKQGTGGKTVDARLDTESLFEQSKTYYWATQKKTSKTKSIEGKDYYATPEPLGYKMIEWAYLRYGDRAMEPSAGHGAIARFFPETTENRFIEPSSQLLPKLKMNSKGEVIISRFEDYNVRNKFDVVVMNPPFGSAGKTAMDHLEKAFNHLDNGGRVIAIVPSAPSMQKRLEKFMDLKANAYYAARIKLPTVVFERAATKVSSEIVIIDRQDKSVDAPQPLNREISAGNIGEFFDVIEDMSVPGRKEPTLSEAEKKQKQYKDWWQKLNPAERLFYMEQHDSESNYPWEREFTTEKGNLTKYSKELSQKNWHTLTNSHKIDVANLHKKYSNNELGSKLDANTKATEFARYLSLGNRRVPLKTTLADANKIIGFQSPFDVVESDKLSIDTPMAFDLDNRVILVNPNLRPTRAMAAQYMVEEIMHGIDAVGPRRTISASSKLFKKGGDIRQEAETHYNDHGDLSGHLRYPLSDEFNYMTETEVQAELFARLGVLYLGDPQRMKEVLPNAYASYHKIFGLESDGAESYVFRKVWGRSPKIAGQVRGQHRAMGEAGRDAAGKSEQQRPSEGLGGIRQAVSGAISGQLLGERIQLSKPADLKSKAPSKEGVSDSGELNILHTKIVTDFSESNRRIREEDRTLWKKAKTYYRQQFLPGGLLPHDVFNEKIKRDSETEAVEFDINHLVGSLESAVKKTYRKPFDKLSRAQKLDLQRGLVGEIKDSVPESVKTILVAMRQYIDSLSIEYAGILQQQVDELTAEGSVEADAKAQLLETVKSNIGTYAHRSYRAFDDPKWFKKVHDNVLTEAQEYLARQYEEKGESREEAVRLAEVTANEILKNGTAYDGIEGFIKESKLGAKDLSVLQKRKQIAPEIRALLGEHIDPRINFAKSATKMGRLVWNERFLARLLEMGKGSFLFEGKNRPAGATVQIAGEGSEAYAPLNGLWTTPEINQAFKDALGKEQMADWYRFIVQMNGLVKYGKTVLSPTTAVRNWKSAMFFALGNGHYNFKHVTKSISGVREYFSSQGKGARLEYLRKLKKLGVVYDTPYAGEMMRLMEESKIEEIMQSRASFPLKTFRNLNKYATKAYQYGDDFWKIIGFENEKNALMKYMPEAEAEVEAAKRIRDTYPTYSMVGRGINWLRRFPLAGTFVSFPAEIIRTQGNILRYIAKDFKEGRKALALRRLSGQVLVASAAYALQAFTKAEFGLDDDEEEAIRLLAAPWERNANLLFTGRDEKGNLQYIDISFLDPYAYFKKPINAILRDQPWEKSAADVFVEMLSPFLGTDIAAGAIFEVLANKNENGKAVWNEKATPIEITLQIADHLRKPLQPGFISNMERTWNALKGERNSSGKVYDLGDEGFAWVGWRFRTLDPKTSLYYRTFEFMDSKKAALQTLTGVIRNINEVGDDDIRSAYRAAQRQYDEAYREMALIVKAAKANGMNKRQIGSVLRSSSIADKDIAHLLKGKTPPLHITKQSVISAAKKAGIVYDRKAAREITRRYELVNTISRN